MFRIRIWLPATALLIITVSGAPRLKNAFTVKGETIALTGESPSYLLKRDATIQKVYLHDRNGRETVFEKGTDYMEVPGGLQRTAQSRIPDFATHRTELQPNGRFSWRPQPMNPPLSLEWQVMVDYTTSLDPPVAPQGRFLGAAMKRKLLAREPLSFYCIGTSITEGAHTAAKHYRNSDESVYARLAAKAVHRLYGNAVSLTNLAVGGSTAALLTAKTAYLLQQRPDLVFIEFGMNEHGKGSDMDGHLAAIERAVTALRSAGITCILVGFFQQNPRWELEDVPSTVYYNNRLREMAARHKIFFADIYNLFNTLPQEKLYRDLMGDYLHHPTAAGHQLYYLAVMPSFLFKQHPESALRNAME